MSSTLLDPARARPDAKQLFSVLAPVLWLLSLAVYLAAEPHGDVGWYLVATDKWLSGGRLYEDVIEVNPPLIFYLNALPVLLHYLTGFTSDDLFVVHVHLLIAISVLLIWRVARDGAEDASGLNRLVPWCAFPVLCVLPLASFGEREHFLLIFALPYIVLAIQRAHGARPPLALAGPVGVFAALGFCLKPQFLVVPLLFEIYRIARHRPLRLIPSPEGLTLGVLTALYAASIPLLTPDYLARVVPFAMLAYGAYKEPVAVVLLSWQTVMVIAFALIYPGLRRRLARPETCDILLMALAAFYAIYLGQMKGWLYHQLPAEAMTFLIVAALLTARPAERGARILRPWLGVATLVAILAIPIARGNERVVANGLLPELRQLPAGAPIVAFSSYVWVGFPLVNLGGFDWPLRFPCLWLLPAAERGLGADGAADDPDRTAALRALRAYTLKAVVDDFASNPPAAVIIDRRPDPRYPDQTFDYTGFFSRDPRFAALWRDYREVTRVTVRGMGPYAVYLRR